MSEHKNEEELNEQEPLILDAAIARVVLMEDRAQVTRSAKLHLPKGRSMISIKGVTALLVDKSIRCIVRTASQQDMARAPRVLDVNVRRKYLVKNARPEAEKEIRSSMEELQDEYLDTMDEMLASHQERNLVKMAEHGLSQQIIDGLKLGPFLPQWEKELDEIFSKRATLESRLLREQWKQDDRNSKLHRLTEELQAACTKIAQYTASVNIEVISETELVGLVEIDYQVPCAIWRPDYTAELIEKDDANWIRWESAGMVWQATGEDWPGVELEFSTDRPALGAELPLLQDDLLSTRGKSNREQEVIEVESRDEQISSTSDVSPSRYDTPPGIDDGGQVRMFKAPQSVDVPGDGLPHRVWFNRWSQEAKVELVCFPEKASFVYLRSEQKNPSEMPLLVGPVRLVRYGTYMGRGEVRYVGPGERFELSWGSDDGLFVRRESIRDYDETSIRKQRKYQYSVSVNIVNYSGQSKQLKLSERIPVSEIEKVDVILDEKKTSSGFTLDNQGLLSWDVSLDDGGMTDLVLDFTVIMPHNVVWQG